MSPVTSIGHHVSIGAGSVLRSVTIENEVVIGIKCVPTRAHAAARGPLRRQTQAGVLRPPACAPAADARPARAPGRPAGAW